MLGLKHNLYTQEYLEELIRVNFPAAKVVDIVPFFINTSNVPARSDTLYYGVVSSFAAVFYKGVEVRKDPGTLVLFDSVGAAGVVSFTGWKITINGDIGAGGGNITPPPAPVDPLSLLKIDSLFGVKAVPGTDDDFIYIRGYEGFKANIRVLFSDGSVSGFGNYVNDAGAFIGYPFVNPGKTVKSIQIHNNGTVYNSYSVPIYNYWPSSLNGKQFTVTNPTTQALDVNVQLLDNDNLLPVFSINPGETKVVDLSAYTFKSVQLFLYNLDSALTTKINFTKPVSSITPFLRYNASSSGRIWKIVAPPGLDIGAKSELASAIQVSFYTNGFYGFGDIPGFNGSAYVDIGIINGTVLKDSVRFPIVKNQVLPFDVIRASNNIDSILRIFSNSPIDYDIKIEGVGGFDEYHVTKNTPGNDYGHAGNNFTITLKVGGNNLGDFLVS